MTIGTTASAILFILGMACFVIALFNDKYRVHLIAGGLLLWALSERAVTLTASA